MLDLFMQMHISGGIVITKVMENFVIVEEKLKILSKFSQKSWICFSKIYW